VFQGNLRLVTSQLWLMPMVGFFGAFQWLCGTDRVFTHGAGMPPPAPSPGAGASNLLGAFDCSGTVSLDGLETRFLVHAGLAIVAFHRMGMDGFISESYHNLRISLQAPEDHLLWNVFLTCPWDSDLGSGRRGDTSDTSLASSPTISELDLCFRCHLRPAGGFLMLGTFARAPPGSLCGGLWARACSHGQPLRNASTKKHMLPFLLYAQTFECCNSTQA